MKRSVARVTIEPLKLRIVVRKTILRELSKYIRLKTEFVLETKVSSHWEQGGCRWLTNIIPAM